MKRLSVILAALLLSVSMASCSEHDGDVQTYGFGADIVQFTAYTDETADEQSDTSDDEPEQTAATAATTSASTTTSSKETTATTTKTASTTTAEPSETTRKYAVTEKAAETVIETSAKSRLEYHKHFSGLSRYSVISIDSKNYSERFRATSYDKWYFYNFGERVVSGYGNDNKAVTVAAYSGIEARITDKRTLNVTAFGNVDKSGISINYENNAGRVNYRSQTLSSSKATASADLWDSCFVNGLYEISCKFTVNGKTDTAYVYLFVNCASDSSKDYEFYLCNGEKHYLSSEFAKNNKQRYSDLMKLFERQGVTPQKALTARRHYPLSAPVDNDDTQYWVTLSHKILKGKENYSAESKALYLHDWMTSNLKYDEYKVRVLGYQRYKDAKGNTYPQYYVSKNYTGVCLDFSSIYAIMCREFGIPCVVLTSSTHAWNAIYLDNRWYEVDLTVDTKRIVEGKDTNKVTNADELYSYYGFCRPEVNSQVAKSATTYCW